MESFRLTFVVTFVVHFVRLIEPTGCDIFVYNQNPPRTLVDEFKDRPANFGAEIRGEGIKALVVAANPRDGCFVDPPPPQAPNLTGNWFLLIARYNCSFEDKIRNAQTAGYDGAIVHNVNSDILEEMSAKNSKGINIPSVFIGESDGLFLLDNYLYNKSYFIIINGDSPANFNHLLLPFAIVVVLCLIIMIIFLVVRCIRERRRARRHRLPYSSLKKIPTCKFAKGDPYDTCAICLDDYVEGDKLRVLPCAHAYHCKCIDPWLTKNRRVCPVCKRKVFANGERPTRRQPVDTSARSAHESQTDSDTDDDRTSLVRSRSDNRTTQGGTFERMRENPFVRAAARAMSERNQLASDMPNSTREDINQEYEESDVRVPQSGTWPESSRGGPFLTGVLNLRGERFPSSQFDNESLTDDRQSLIGAGPSPMLKSGTSNSGSSRSRDKSGRKISNESNSKRSRKNGQNSRQSRRRGSDTTQTSSNSERSFLEAEDYNNDQVSHACDDVEGQHNDNQESQGRIGIVALPNVNILERQNNRSRGNDFII